MGVERALHFLQRQLHQHVDEAVFDLEAGLGRLVEKVFSILLHLSHRVIARNGAAEAQRGCVLHGFDRQRAQVLFEQRFRGFDEAPELAIEKLVQKLKDVFENVFGHDVPFVKTRLLMLTTKDREERKGMGEQNSPQISVYLR